MKAKWMVMVATAFGANGDFFDVDWDRRFRGYVLRATRDLVPHEERLARIGAGKPIPRLVRVGVRKTMSEITCLASRWGA